MDKYGLSNKQIVWHAGPQALARGGQYFRQKRVISIDFDEDGGGIVAIVRGTKNYKVEVLFTPIKGGVREIDSSDCSCPVGGRCKHVVAALFMARQKLAESVPEAELAVQPTTTPKNWQLAFDNLLKEIDRNNKTKSSNSLVGIIFELQHTTPIKKYYGNGGFGLSNSGKIKLGLRPVMRNVHDTRWVNSGITWDRVGGSYGIWGNLTNPNPQHKKWFREFWALYQASASDEYRSYYIDKWLYLDEYKSDSVYRFLHRGQEIGIPFMTNDKDQSPLQILSDPVVPRLNITQQKNGDLKVNATLYFQGVKLNTSSRLIGDPASAAYLWTDNPNDSLKTAKLVLVPLDPKIPSQLANKISKGTSTLVPAADIDDFKQHYYPLLAKTLPINAAKTVRLPVVGKPQLQLRIKANGTVKLNIKLNWLYSVGTAEYTMPIWPQADKVEPVLRQDNEEQIILNLFANIMTGQTESLYNKSTNQLLDDFSLDGMAAVAFVTTLLPVLQSHQTDILVSIEGVLPDYQEFIEEPLIQIGTKAVDDGGTDWFDLRLSFKIGQVEVSMSELLLALDSNQPYLVLENGVFFRLDHPTLLQLKAMIQEARTLRDKESGSLRLSKFQVGLWDELQALGIVTEQAEAWRQSLKGLLDIKSIPAITPSRALHATLRPYQKQGLSWLVFLHEHNLGGILADDMGLGKTLQALALFLYLRGQQSSKDHLPNLVIAPTSVAANWVGESARFAPSLKVVAISQTSVAAGASLKERIKRADLVISTYTLMRINEEEYLKQDWDCVIFDEAQFIKNHQSKSYQVARKLTTSLKVMMTGTPMENNLMELWSLLSITAPGLFPSPKRFAEQYQVPIEKRGDAELLKQLRQRVRPLMLRRTKEQVLNELPPKIEQVLELELNPDHRKVYDMYLQRERQRVLGLLDDFGKNRFMILKVITTLRQLSLDPKLVDATKYKHISSTKLDGLLEQLDEVLADGHRALIFSQFTSFLGSVRQALNSRGIKHLYLDGATKKRGDLLEQFKTTAVPLFLISLKAGGFGLNLTEADYCFLLDPWWNPAVEQQAIDRTHRIGQKKQVMVYRLVAKGTIEEKVMALKARKLKLFKSLLDEGELFSSGITPEDIRGLFD